MKKNAKQCFSWVGAGDLVKMQILGSRAGPENLHFQPVRGEVEAAGVTITIRATWDYNLLSLS